MHPARSSHQRAWHLQNLAPDFDATMGQGVDPLASFADMSHRDNMSRRTASYIKGHLL